MFGWCIVLGCDLVLLVLVLFDWFGFACDVCCVFSVAMFVRL